jgi:hypothetical protein
MSHLNIHCDLMLTRARHSHSLCCLLVQVEVEVEDMLDAVDG